MKRRALLLVAIAILAILPGRAAQAPAPIVILVSIDGWRWDYIDKTNAPNIKALAARGVRSQGLIPSFPSVTFPNHYTLVTGLVPDHHGIIANAMVDRSIGTEKFTMSSDTAKNPAWWGGEPIWQTVIRNGGKSAAMFWPGSEAIKPTYWRAFDDDVPNMDRVAQVLEWLRLPEADRPSFSTLYFSEIDHVGHDFGPDAPELLTAAEHVDAAIGQLVWGIEDLGLAERTSIVLVSDHGMAATSSDRVIYLDDYLQNDEIEVVDWSPNIEINPATTSSADAIYQKLANKHPALAVYRRADLPKWLNYGTNKRIPAVIGIAELGWTITTHAAAKARLESGRSFTGGGHGYDPRYRELHGLFIAAGPGLRRGVIVPEFRNVHVYNVLCKLLGLAPAPNDGDLSEVASLWGRTPFPQVFNRWGTGLTR
ncbi:MAG: alkaline phosphatase family protein [Acidobacteria bacterium]|nr:MAG: alkaline phosphatase family protein [Acidobacteriota bacterium]